MTNLFVSGSGTEVGKTFVTTMLINEIRKTDRPVIALKPVISGFADDDVGESDTGLILEALGLDVTPDNIEKVSPWRFRAPIAPTMAATLEGRELDIHEIAAFCQMNTSPNCIKIIEGVGGVMVPLTNQATVLDLMVEVGAPVLLVAGSYLGTLSHTLTALHTVQDHGLKVLGIVVSESLDSEVPLSETKATLSHFSHGVPVIELPRLSAEVKGQKTPSIARKIGLF